MRRTIIHLVLAALTIFGMLPSLAAGLEEGRDYTVLQPARPTSNPQKIEVTEYFSYQCPHCYAFSPSLDKWAAKLPADVAFERQSVSIGHAQWEASARTFYTLQALGKLADLDRAVFRAIHVDHVNMQDEARIAAWMAEHGIKTADFLKAYESFGVDAKWKQGEHLAMTHEIPSIPTLVIDGKYLVAIASNIDFQLQLSTVDALIAKARAEKKNTVSR